MALKDLECGTVEGRRSPGERLVSLVRIVSKVLDKAETRSALDDGRRGEADGILVGLRGPIALQGGRDEGEHCPVTHHRSGRALGRFGDSLEALARPSRGPAEQTRNRPMPFAQAPCIRLAGSRNRPRTIPSSRGVSRWNDRTRSRALAHSRRPAGGDSCRRRWAESRAMTGRGRGFASPRTWRGLRDRSWMCTEVGRFPRVERGRGSHSFARSSRDDGDHADSLSVGESFVRRDGTVPPDQDVRIRGQAEPPEKVDPSRLLLHLEVLLSVPREDLDDDLQRLLKSNVRHKCYHELDQQECLWGHSFSSECAAQVA